MPASAPGGNHDQPYRPSGIDGQRYRTGRGVLQLGAQYGGHHLRCGAPGGGVWQPEDQSATVGAGVAQPGAGGVGGCLPYHPLAAGAGDGPAGLPRGGDCRGAGDQKRRLRADRVSLFPRPGSKPD